MPTTISSPQTILARCVHSQSHFTRFEPLLSCVAGQWKEVGDPNLTFPEVGTVFSFDPMTMNAEVGSFWMFETEPSTRYVPGRGHDKFLARDPRPAMQVIDYSKLTLEKVRYELVEVGIPISRALTAEVIVCLAGDLCVRLSLTPDMATNRRKADVHGLQDAALMRCYPEITSGAMAAGAMFLLPGREPHEIVDYVDWSPDDEFFSGYSSVFGVWMDEEPT